MDRQIVYPGAIPLETDLLNTNRNTMTALGKLIAAMFGSTTTINGLACTPTSPASLQVNVAPGEIYALENLDASAYSSLAADTVHNVMKQGIMLNASVLNCPAPATAGLSINYLIEAAFAEVDGGATVLPYYNSSNAAIAYSGPGNSGAAQNTIRQGEVQLQVKAGAAATTGTQTTPAPDASYIGLYVVTVANGQSTITSANISAYSGAPVLPNGGVYWGGLQVAYSNSTLFEKAASALPCLTKTAASTLSILAGTRIAVAGTLLNFTANTAVVMPTLTAGTDYAVYACTDGTVRADSSFASPAGYTTANSRMIGGFHYSLIAPATTASIANGFNTTSSVSRAGGTTSGNAVVTGLASTTDLMVGMAVSGTGIGTSAFIQSVDSASQVTLTVNSTATGTPTITFTNTGMVWVQSNVDDIAGINKYSLWDLKFRPVGANPQGMALVGGRTWVDIYLCSTDTAANGTSKYNTNIASGTVLPKIPAAFGGNGTTTYPALNWWVANELARSNQKRLMWEHEFVDAAYGVSESRSIDATASTYPTTLHNAGYTSKYGIEQASGHHLTWGQDSNFYSEAASPAWTWKDVNGNTGAVGAGRGQVYSAGTYGLSRVLLGGSRASGSGSGSRASNWSDYPWYSVWNGGLRAACDHFQVP